MNVQLETIDEYIAGFPLEIQAVLEQIRATIRAAAPDATEAIKYAMRFKITSGFIPRPAALRRSRMIWPCTGNPKAPFASRSAHRFRWS
jgi:hypothetical protein